MREIPSPLSQGRQLSANLVALRGVFGTEDAPDPDAFERALAAYGNWGYVAPVFDERQERFDGHRAQLLSLLGDRANAALRASILNSYYTPAWLAEAMWRGIRQLGFDGGLALEPAAGSGALMHAPTDLASRVRWTAVESCPATAAVLGARLPDARIVNATLQDTSLVYQQFDLAVLNPPFGEEIIDDSYDRELGWLSIHNLFMAKTLRCVRPGGLMVALVSHWFLDSETDRARRLVADTGRLVKALRLPGGIFPGTDVVCDLLFFKRIEDGAPGNADAWLGTHMVGTDSDGVTINDWYRDHPHDCLGDLAVGTDQYGKAALRVTPADDTRDRLHAALARLPGGTFESLVLVHEDEYDPKIVVEDDDRTLLYGYAIDTDGRPVQRGTDNAGLRRFRRVALAESKTRRLAGLLRIRDALKDLIARERDTQASEAALDALRAMLRDRYHAFSKTFGAIHGVGNAPFRDDPEFGLLMSLELDYDPGIGKVRAAKEGVAVRAPAWREADILNRRVLLPGAPVAQPRNPEDALIQSVRRTGGVDLPGMAAALGRDAEGLADELTGRIFLDPASSQWRLSESYLSGNVRVKLAQARAAAARDERYRINVEALQDVLPADIPAGDITAPVGAPWVPGTVLKAFVKHMIGFEMPTSPVLAAGTWYIELADYQGSHALNRIKYGTGQRAFADLFKRLCNNQPLTVTVEDDEGRRVTDIEATAEAEAKADEIREAWQDWLFQDPEQRERLVRLYNDTFNNYVAPQVDGRVLVDENGLLPGQSGDVRLDRHQLDAVYRGVLEGNLLCDMAVGSGKTFTAVALIMELRRMGLLGGGKAMVVVPNHLVVQWRSEAALLYPAARVIAAEKRDLERLNRRRFFGTIAANDADLIILPMSAYPFIEPPAEFTTQLLGEQVTELEHALQMMDKDARFSRRRIEKRLATLRGKIERLVKRPRRDLALSFDDLGITLVVQDEQQYYKNLAYSTNLHNVAGMGNPEGSQRAFDAWAKGRYLQIRQDGRGLISLTGTPVSNSLTELWTLFRFHAYWDLEASGLQWLDSWIALHAEPGTAYELGVDGSYKARTRLRAFHNVPELLKGYATFVHVVTKDDLKAQYHARGELWPEPEMTGGRPTLVVCPRNAAQDAYFADILERAQRMGEMDPSEDNWLKLTSDAMLASLDMRLHDPAIDDEGLNKVNRIAEEVVARYRKWHHVKGTQLVFCDAGVPGGARGGFVVYEALKQALVEAEIPGSEIAFIHDANTDARKVDLYRRMNSGEVRVLVASTEKGGAGLNVQARLVALHMADCPWRPSDMTQRMGRGLRRGNVLHAADPLGFTLDVIWYATDRTLDAVRYATVETKAKFIDQLRKGGVKDRVIADIDDDVVTSFGDMKAKISGNPLLRLHHQTEQDIRTLERKERTWRRNQHHAEDYLARHADHASVAEQRRAALAVDLAAYRSCQGHLVLDSGGVRYAGTEFKDGLMASVNAALKQSQWRLRTGVDLGALSGLALHLFKHGKEIEFRIAGQEFRASTYYGGGEEISLTGLIRRLTHRLSDIEAVAQEIDAWERHVEQEMVVMRDVLGTPFGEGDTLVRKRELLRALVKALAEKQTTLPEAQQHLLDPARGEAVAEADAGRDGPVPQRVTFAVPGVVTFAVRNAA